jgi:hypothetical protein
MSCQGSSQRSKSLGSPEHLPGVGDLHSSLYKRNKQVACMGKIYHRATKVHAWVGEAANDSKFII